MSWLRLRVRMLRAKIEGLSGTPLETEIDMLSPEYLGHVLAPVAG